MARLAGDVATAAASPGDWLTTLSQGVRTLCGVDGVIAGFVNVADHPHRRAEVGHVGVSGLDSGELRTFEAYSRDEKASDPLLERFVTLPAGVHTVDRRALVDDPEWYRSRFVRDYRSQGSVDHYVLSMANMRSDATFGLGLHMRKQAGPVSVRAAKLAEVVVHSVLPLARRELRRATPLLSAHQRRVLEQFLRGASEKEAAEALGVSIHAVHYHAKILYKAFGARTRAELIVAATDIARRA